MKITFCVNSDTSFEDKVQALEPSIYKGNLLVVMSAHQIPEHEIMLGKFLLQYAEAALRSIEEQTPTQANGVVIYDP